MPHIIKLIGIFSDFSFDLKKVVPNNQQEHPDDLPQLFKLFNTFTSASEESPHEQKTLVLLLENV